MAEKHPVPPRVWSVAVVAVQLTLVFLAFCGFCALIAATVAPVSLPGMVASLMLGWVVMMVLVSEILR